MGTFKDEWVNSYAAYDYASQMDNPRTIPDMTCLRAPSVFVRPFEATSTVSPGHVKSAVNQIHRTSPRRRAEPPSLLRSDLHAQATTIQLSGLDQSSPISIQALE